jgi:hypothetical protein
VKPGKRPAQNAFVVLPQPERNSFTLLGPERSTDYRKCCFLAPFGRRQTSLTARRRTYWNILSNNDSIVNHMTRQLELSRRHQYGEAAARLITSLGALHSGNGECLKPA